MDTVYGDTQLGASLGHDLLIRGEDGEAAAGQAEPGDTVIPDDIQGATHSYQVNGYTAQYREDPETGKIQVYNYELGQWDTVGERYWDAEHNAWITDMGQVVIAEYANKTIQYENYGDAAWIRKDGAWKPYDPDDQYIVDFREDPVTGELLVYNNDLGTWDPYMREYTPAGKDYTVLNEGGTIFIEHNDESVLWLENYGEGASINAPGTGYTPMNLPGSLAYHDPSSNVWYSYGWETWSYSIDVGDTWKDVSMLDFRIMDGGGAGEAGTLAAESVNVYDGQGWYAKAGELQFVDSRYAQSGWHSMDEFYVDLYDGMMYNGEPLRVVDMWDTDEIVHNSDYQAVLGLSPSGGGAEPPPADAKITYWKRCVYGAWSNLLVCSYEVPNPSEDYRGDHSEPLTIMFAGELGKRSSANSISPLDRAVRCVDINVLYTLHGTEFSVATLVKEAQVISYVTGQSFRTIAAIDHSNIDYMTFGVDHVRAQNFHAMDYDDQFRELKEVLAGGAQIQYFGCSVAGPNPYYSADTAAKIDTANTYENMAWSARRMLSSIAAITGATVFASSDDSDQGLEFTLPFRIVKVHPRDYSLEFVVGPDSKQIPWIFTLPGDSERPINRVFDPQIWGNPQAIDVDKPNEWPYVSAVPMPPCTIPTIGENFITKYDPL